MRRYAPDQYSTYRPSLATLPSLGTRTRSAGTELKDDIEKLTAQPASEPDLNHTWSQVNVSIEL